MAAVSFCETDEDLNLIAEAVELSFSPAATDIWTKIRSNVISLIAFMTLTTD
jgi:hypothetical protein